MTSDILAFKHTNVTLNLFAPGNRLRDVKDLTVFFPLVESEFALLSMKVETGDFAMNQHFTYLISTNHILVDTWQWGETFLRSDDSFDAHGLHNKFLYHKSSIDNFEFVKDKGTSEQIRLVMTLKDGNLLKSIGFKDTGKASELRKLERWLVDLLKVKKWDVRS